MKHPRVVRWWVGERVGNGLVKKALTHRAGARHLPVTYTSDLRISRHKPQLATLHATTDDDTGCLNRRAWNVETWVATRQESALLERTRRLVPTGRLVRGRCVHSTTLHFTTTILCASTIMGECI